MVDESTTRDDASELEEAPVAAGSQADAAVNEPVEEAPEVSASNAEEVSVEPADAEEESAKPAKNRGPIEEIVEEEEEEDLSGMDWFILKVQSNRENSICDALKRRVAVALCRTASCGQRRGPRR